VQIPSNINQPEHLSPFEQGPIRPPNEADSLLVRVTRNCPWNRCTFCPVYKGTTFSIRPVDHVLHDIDAVARHVDTLTELQSEDGVIQARSLQQTLRHLNAEEAIPFQAAYHWMTSGNMESVFLQDANSLVTRTENLISILTHLRERFPQIRRITTYARSHTVARMADSQLKASREAGLTRLHVGLESGSDAVLKMIQKGANKAMHIRAGLKTKAAGLELSEYIMPGLGGHSLWREHADETADTLNQINPDFIRLRTLGISVQTSLSIEAKNGRFQKCTDLEVVRELVRFFEKLDRVTSHVVSDHILNLLPEVEGQLPREKPVILSALNRFLNLDPHDQQLFQIGRRMGLLGRLAHLDDPACRERTEKAYQSLMNDGQNVDAVCDMLLGQCL